jgi:hypothetical protein
LSGDSFFASFFAYFLELWITELARICASWVSHPWLSFRLFSTSSDCIDGRLWTAFSLRGSWNPLDDSENCLGFNITEPFSRDGRRSLGLNSA